VLIPCLLAAAAQLAPNRVIYDELEPIYPDMRASQLEPGPHTSATALGQRTAVHILVDGEDGQDIQLSVRPRAGGNAPAGIQIARLISVPVEENTGLVSRTEQFDGETNPHVIRRAPFRVYDAIEPLPMISAKNQVRSSTQAEFGAAAFRVSWQPQQAGSYEWTITAGDHELHWVVEVFDFQLPPRRQLNFAYTNWFSVDEIATQHHVELWSPEFWDLLHLYAALMVDGGQDTFWLRWQDFFAKNERGKWQLHHDRLERYVTTFLAAGMHWIEGAPIARRPGGDWSTDWLELRFDSVRASSPEGKKLIQHLARQLRSAFRTNDWSRQWIQHIADEPTDVNADDYRKLAEELRKHLADVPIVEATMTEQLAGAIDIWCPQVHKYQASASFFAERRAAGDQVWTYTCLVPGGRWLNRLLDQERLRQVYLGWAGFRYDTQGYLHWGLNHYKANPYVQSVVDHPAQPKTSNKLPAGDTHVIYPGAFGPLSSTRFEAHRIGLEDLSLLRLLAQHDPEQADALTAKVFRSYDDWEASVESYRKARRQLLSATAQLFQTK